MQLVCGKAFLFFILTYILSSLYEKEKEVKAG